MKKKFFIIFGSMVGLGLIGYYFIHSGFYPVAFVNSSLVSARNFDEASASVMRYYSQTLKIEGNERLKQARQEIRRATLDKLIENELIYNALDGKVGSNLSGLVENKIKNLKIESSNLKEAVSDLYGLSLERFKELVLEPEAWEELLTDELRSNKSDFNEWLKKERGEASIIILAPDLKWDGEKVTLK